MKRILLLFSLVVAATAAQAQPGTIDSTFGLNGIVQNTFNRPTRGSAVAVQPDGKIVVAGSLRGDTTQLCLARFLPDGSPDNSFGNGGRVIQSISHFWDEFNALVIQPDGKIIAGGWAFYGSPNDDYLLIRYLSNGTPDPTFGTNGVVHTDVGGATDRINDMVLQSDGKIIAVGYSLLPVSPYSSRLTAARYMPDGTLDNTFGVNGTIAGTAPSGGHMYANAVDLQPDGKLVIGGYMTVNNVTSFIACRLLATGMPDATFVNASGTASTLFSIQAMPTDMVLQSDGKIIVLGIASTPQRSSVALTRFNSNGTLDATYGQGGHTIQDIEQSDYIQAGICQADGKLLVTGYVGAQNNKGQSQLHFGLARFRTDGILDSSFGNNGYVITAIGNNHAYANAIALQPDKRILLCGNLSDVSVNTMFSDGLAVARYLDTTVTTPPPPPPTNGIGDIHAAISHLSLYPNPVQTRATLQYELEKPGSLSITLLDASGKPVMTWAKDQRKAAGSYSEVLHFDPALPAGNYLLQLSNGAANASLKLVIRR